MNRTKILSIVRRRELVKRLGSGDDLATLAQDFRRSPRTIARIRQKIENEGSDWYLKPAKRGPKPGGTNPKAGRFPQRRIVSAEKERIRKHLEKQHVSSSSGKGGIEVDLQKFKIHLKNELGFSPVKKTVLALLGEWGMKPLLAAPGALPKLALQGSAGGELILKRERERRKKVNRRIQKEKQKEVKFFGAPKKGFTGAKMKWRHREVHNEEVCDFLLEFWTASQALRFDEWGKGICRRELMRMAKHSGIEVLTYVIMDTHCFAVVRLASRENWLQKFSVGTTSENEEAILAHAALRFDDYANYAFSQKERLLRGAERAEFFRYLKNSFCDLSLSAKMFKEAVTRVMNERFGKAGQFWEERFGSKRLHTPEDLRKAGLRVDGWARIQGLLVDEPPEAYPWCGFSEAVGGSKRFRKGLCRVMGIPMDRWKVSTKIDGFGPKGLPANLYRKSILRGE